MKASFVALALVLSFAAAFAARAAEPVRPLQVLVDEAAADPAENRAGHLIAEMWRALGLEIRVVELPAKKKLETLYWERGACDGAPCFDVALWSSGQLRPLLDPDEALTGLLHSAAIEAGANVAALSDADLDALLEAQRGETDPVRRRLLVREAEALAAREAAYVPLVAPTATVVLRRDLLAEGAAAMGPWRGVATLLELRPRAADKPLVLTTAEKLPILSPLARGEGGALLRELVWDRLFRLDREGMPQPWAASSARWLDAVTLELTLRPGMRWHDGAPVVADDVVFSLAEVGGVAPALARALKPIAAAVALADGQGVRIHLDRPYAPLLATALAEAPLLPAHIFRPLAQALMAEGRSFEEVQPEALIGSGPYRVELWRPGKEAVLAANPEHWAPPEAAELRLLLAADAAQALALLARGEAMLWADAGIAAPGEALRRAEAQAPGLARLEGAGVGMVLATFNLRRAPYDDPAFRRALAAAIDRGRLVREAWGGQAAATGSLVPPALAAWRDPAADAVAGDPALALRMLEAAGYRRQGGRLYLPEPRRN